MNNFRIILENTFKFKEGKLYLMMIRENEVYGVEVVDREKTFGRKYAKNREQADLLFDKISTKLSKLKRLSDAEQVIERCFSSKTIDKTLFILMADDKILTQTDIVKMNNQIEFWMTVKIGFNKMVKDEDSLTVYVYETSKRKKPFGVLVGDAFGKNLKFELL